jgi:hypothetical protein
LTAATPAPESAAEEAIEREEAVGVGAAALKMASKRLTMRVARILEEVVEELQPLQVMECDTAASTHATSARTVSTGIAFSLGRHNPRSFHL